MNKSDHDLLVTMNANLTNLIGLVENHRKDFKSHIENDSANFKALGIQITDLEDKQDRKHNFLLRIVLPATGAVSFGILLVNWFHK